MSSRKKAAAVALGKRRLAAPKPGEKNADAVTLGALGGAASAAALTREQRVEKARKAINTRWRRQRTATKA